MSVWRDAEGVSRARSSMQFTRAHNHRPPSPVCGRPRLGQRRKIESRPNRTRQMVGHRQSAVRSGIRHPVVHAIVCLSCVHVRLHHLCRASNALDCTVYRPVITFCKSIPSALVPRLVACAPASVCGLWGPRRPCAIRLHRKLTGRRPGQKHNDGRDNVHESPPHMPRQVPPPSAHRTRSTQTPPETTADSQIIIDGRCRCPRDRVHRLPRFGRHEYFRFNFSWPASGRRGSRPDPWRPRPRAWWPRP